MKDESLMDGKKYEASFFAKKLRENIWMEHFGIEREEANDPLSDSLWDLIKQRSQVSYIKLKKNYNKKKNQNQIKKKSK